MVIIGGEPAYRDDVLRFCRHCLPGSLLINTLGCTELPTYRYFPIDHETELTDASVPAGQAVPGADATIVRDDGTEAVNGEIGEIVVASRYLALGYLNLPAETATRFVSRADGTRLFRTGDLGAISKDGILKHVGRKDSLVKILGNRVELGEIETALRLHPAVRDACVVAQPEDSSNFSLRAFVAPHEMPGPAGAALKSHLRARLPDYMIPAQIENLAVLPLNRNGKIDRKGLEKLKSACPSESMIRHPPQTDAERRVAQICQAVLGLDSIDIDQNLFDLGANSIIAMMIASRLMIAFGVETPRTLVFDLPTVSGLVAFLAPDGEIPTEEL